MAINKNTSMGKSSRVAMQDDPLASIADDQTLDPSAVANENASADDQDLTDEPGED